MAEETPAASPPAEPQSREQRIEAYQAKLRQLKERSALREVVERELLLEFIRVNRSNINEFPLLESQQNSVISVLCQRSEHPCYEYIRKLAGNFIVLLGHDEKEQAGQDETAKEATRTLLTNAETLLIKCAQGVVLALGLVTDNFEEIVLRHFGATALNDYNDLVQENQIDQGFWKAFVERFAARQVAEAHAEILARKKYVLSKVENLLVVRFHFDDVVADLHPTAQKVEKTRIQAAFEQNVADDEGRTTIKLVHGCLLKGLDFISESLLSKSDVRNIASIVCIDRTTRELKTRYLAAMQGEAASGEDVVRERLNVRFLMEQVVAEGVGAAIAVNLTREQFALALWAYTPEEAEQLKVLSESFALGSLEKLLFGLIEAHFLKRLREQVRDESGKVLFRTARARRSPVAAVEALVPLKLTKIRKNKFFRPDPARADMLLFRPRVERELAALMQVLLVEDELRVELERLWESAPFKVEILATLDLAQLTKTTTNMKARLAEILGKLGITQQRPEAQPAPAEPAQPESPAETPPAEEPAG